MNRPITVEIEKMVYGGQGMGRVGGKVVFVAFTAPGERVEAETVTEKRDYAEAHPRRIERRSALRVEPFCSLYGECGGCQYQHFSYPEELRLKEEAVREALFRLIRKGSFEILPILASPRDREYRIRAQFKTGTREGRRFFGFHAWRTHRVVEVEKCPLLHPLAGRILAGMNRWLKESRDPSLRGADLQVSPEEGRGVLSLRTETPWEEGRAREAGERIGGLKGLVAGGDKRRVAWGDPVLSYEGPGPGGERIRFQTGGDSFVQVNPGQNRNLVLKVAEWAGLRGEERVLDLFCGSGNLTLPLARKAARVWGVDQDRQAIDHARRNARQNGLLHCSFLAAPSKEGIARVREEARTVDVAVLDPPRVGARETLESLVSLRPRKILYVSCEPPTLSRDLARLAALGYPVRRLQPLDMFPRTYHVEVIAELEAAGGRLSAGEEQ